jgi:hypothetical protein
MCMLHSFSNHTATNGKDTAKRSNILKFNIVSDSDSFIQACKFEPRSRLCVLNTTHYVIKFVSDLRQVGGFLQVLPIPPVINLTL